MELIWIRCSYLSNVQNFIQISPAIILRFFSKSFGNFTLHLALKCGTILQCLSFLTLILSKMSLEFGLSCFFLVIGAGLFILIRSHGSDIISFSMPHIGRYNAVGDSDFDVWWCLTGLLPCKVTYKFISIQRENCIFWGHTLR